MYLLGWFPLCFTLGRIDALLFEHTTLCAQLFGSTTHGSSAKTVKPDNVQGDMARLEV